jgi:hypothetical protein
MSFFMRIAHHGLTSLVAVLATAGLVLPPLDEAETTPDVMKTRNAAIAAFRNRDVRALRRLLAPDVKAFGGEQDVEKIIATFVADADSASDHGPAGIAAEVVAALQLGGSFTTTRGSVRGERQFCAPYTYSAFPKDYPPPKDSDGTPLVVIERSVRLLEQPDRPSAVLDTLSYSIVYGCAEGKVSMGGRSWCHVETVDGKLGYVPATAVRDPADYHVCFGQRGASWLITVIERDRFPFE